MKVLFVYGAFENLGIEYLSAVLKQGGHSTRLAFDPKLFNDPFICIKPLAKFFNYEKTILKQAKNYKPGIIAFSVVSSDYAWALRLAGQMKKECPAVHITFGGIHPSSVPEKVLENEQVDSVVVGEGEYPLLELANSIEKGKLNYNIKNIWFKYDGRIIKNELRPYIEDLDSLPFPDKELYYKIIPQYKSGYKIITRRGCVNSCTYCHNSIWQALYPGKEKIRLRSVGNVIQELQEAKRKYHFNRLRINDDLFTYNEKWLRDFSQEYKKYINAPVYCFGSPATINENVIGYLKDMSCYQVCIGVQSTSEILRKKVLNREESNDCIKEAIRLCRKHKIRCVVDNIIGLPEEKEEDLIAMAQFYNDHRPDRACVFWLIYFPKTPIINSALKAGILDKDDVENLENNPLTVANTLQNQIHEKRKLRYHWLILLIHFFPRCVCDWFIKKKLYRFLPRCQPALIEIPLTLLAKDRFDIPRSRYYIRYFSFLRKIIISKIKVNSF